MLLNHQAAKQDQGDQAANLPQAVNTNDRRDKAPLRKRDIDLDRLVWDLEYRQSILEEAKRYRDGEG